MRGLLPYALIALVIFASVTTVKGVSMYKQRGLRNNNAGNIRHSGSNWLGKSPVQPDSAFVTFTTPEYGIRALYKVLISYRNKHGLSTVRGIINRWAPPIENNTDAYVKNVARELNINPDTVLSLSDYPSLIASIIKHENGIQPYSIETIKKGVALA